MACFIVTAAEAVVVSTAQKVESKKDTTKQTSDHIPMSRKLRWLSSMLWGGAILLAFEHIWHGEVVPWFPFLTAMADPGDAAEMFHEMATVGVCMAVLVTLVWVGMCLVADSLVKKADKTAQSTQ